jgi:type I restriction enzyme, S subunit
MDGEIARVKLADVSEMWSGGTPSKDRADYWGGDLPWVSAKDMKERRLRDAEDHITESGLASSSRVAPVNATLVLVRGMTLLDDVPICSLAREMAFNQDVKAIVPTKEIEPDYLTYALLAAKPELLSMVELAGHGTGRLPTDRLKALQIPLPSKREQRSVADIFRALDDKIELNRRMSETLDACVRAIFKSWFVEFEPVRAKIEGRWHRGESLLGLPADLHDLFPDTFESSKLGKIPSGWETATLEAFASLNPESWSSNTRPATIQYIDLSNAKRGRIEAVATYSRTDAPSRAQRVLRPRDSIVGTVRPGNRSYALISDDGLTGSTGFAVLRPRKSVYAEFIYLASTAPANIEALAHLADGAAYPAVRPEVVVALPIAKPAEQILSRFSAIAAPKLAAIARNESESRTLAAIRDTLLPKLISGEIRVRSAARVANEEL